MGGCHPLSGNVTRVVGLSRVIIIIIISKVSSSSSVLRAGDNGDNAKQVSRRRTRPRAPACVTRGCAGTRPGNRRFVVTHGNRRDRAAQPR